MTEPYDQMNPQEKYNDNVMTINVGCLLLTCILGTPGIYYAFEERYGVSLSLAFLIIMVSKGCAQLIEHEKRKLFTTLKGGARE
jgi:hypothetical protein